MTISQIRKKKPWMYLHLCVFVHCGHVQCVNVWEKEQERETERERACSCECVSAAEPLANNPHKDGGEGTEKVNVSCLHVQRVDCKSRNIYIRLKLINTTKYQLVSMFILLWEVNLCLFTNEQRLRIMLPEPVFVLDRCIFNSPITTYATVSDTYLSFITTINIQTFLMWRSSLLWFFRAQIISQNTSNATITSIKWVLILK